MLARAREETQVSEGQGDRCPQSTDTLSAPTLTRQHRGEGRGRGPSLQPLLLSAPFSGQALGWPLLCVFAHSLASLGAPNWLLCAFNSRSAARGLPQVTWWVGKGQEARCDLGSTPAPSRLRSLWAPLPPLTSRPGPHLQSSPAV